MSGNTQLAQRSKSVSAALQAPAIKKKIDELLGKRSSSFCSTLVQISRSSNMLAKADPNSVIGAAITAATLDLPINPNLGFAYVVPYGQEAQFQIGWKGLVQLALRSGKYEKMVPFKVNEEAFIYFNPLTEALEIDTSKLDQEAENIVGYGFYFKLINGFEKTVYWTRERCEAHGKRYSQTFRRGFGVWADNFDAMALKTVIKNALGQFGILSVEMQNAIEQDQSVSHGVDNESIDYADNAGDEPDPMAGMRPAEAVVEEEEPVAVVAEEPAKEEPAKPESDAAKVKNSLKVLLKHREEDFKAACENLGIPFDMWDMAKAPRRAELLQALNG